MADFAYGPNSSTAFPDTAAPPNAGAYVHDALARMSDIMAMYDPKASVGLQKRTGAAAAAMARTPTTMRGARGPEPDRET